MADRSSRPAGSTEHQEQPDGQDSPETSDPRGAPMDDPLAPWRPPSEVAQSEHRVRRRGGSVGGDRSDDQDSRGRREGRGGRGHREGRAGRAGRGHRDGRAGLGRGNEAGWRGDRGTDTRRPDTPGPQQPSERARAALRLVRIFAVVLLAALWLGFLAPPWPLPLLAGVLAAVSLVVGVRALVAALQARVRGAVVPMLVVGLVLALLTMLTTAGQALYWNEFAAYDECRAAALTVQAQTACDAELERSIRERLPAMDSAATGG